MAKKELIVVIDENLKREFKKTCAIHDDTMSSIVVNCVKKYISEKNKKCIY